MEAVCPGGRPVRLDEQGSLRCQVENIDLASAVADYRGSAVDTVKTALLARHWEMHRTGHLPRLRTPGAATIVWYD